MNKTILSVKEHLKILEEEISRYFPNLPDTPFALARSPFTIKVQDVPENAQEEFIELIYQRWFFNVSYQIVDQEFSVISCSV